MQLEILPPFRPILGAVAFDGGGREVIGWVHCARWRALLGWVELLCDRNIHGCLAYATNPEPWPSYYWAIEVAESSHLNSPWYWSEVAESVALQGLYRTLRDVHECYPQATPEQIEDVLLDMGLI